MPSKDGLFPHLTCLVYVSNLKFTKVPENHKVDSKTFFWE